MSLLILVTLLFSTIPWSYVYGQCANPCPGGWTNHGKKCYRRFDEKMSHDDNKARCDQVGAIMVSIKSDDESKFLKNFLNSPNVFNYYWTSGKQIGRGSSHFKWGDGSELGYTNWRPKEPSEYWRDKDICMDICFAERQWCDYPCHAGLYGLCEKPTDCGGGGGGGNQPETVTVDDGWRALMGDEPHDNYGDEYRDYYRDYYY